MNQMIENPDKKELRENYKVREMTNIKQFEKETTIRTDKSKPRMVHYYSDVGSHMRKVIKNENPEIEITKAIVDEDEGNIHAIFAKMPIANMTISLKGSPKQTSSMARLISG